MRGNARRSTRVAAYVASGALAISGLAFAASPVQGAVDPQPENQAANWLVGELTGGVVHNAPFDFDDIALSADFAYALAATGGHASTVDTILDTIEPRAHDEWYTSTFGGVTTTYSGSIAKLLVLVQQTGGTPTDFGGQNLVSLLGARVATAAPIAGRIQNANDSFGDANVIGQAFAAHGLKTANSAKAADVTSFLLEQQCSSGYFRLAFNTSKTSTRQSCVDGTSEPDTDVTAIAVQQLASQAADTTVAAAIAKAKSWLVAQQRCDGSFGGGTSTEGSNANSTGLVAWALGDTPTSRQAAVWLRAHQATPADSGNSLAGETGAIAYDDAGLAAGRTDGITDGIANVLRRASSQAAPGLAWFSTDATPALSLAGSTGYVMAGGTTTFTTSGAEAGTVLCLRGANASKRGIATASPWRTRVTLPAGTANRTYRVRDPYGHSDTAILKVLGKKTLEMRRSKTRVKRSHTVYASIYGLAPGERARIYYKGRLIRRGTATSAGRFTARFSVGRSLGRKRITGYGQFSRIRQGRTAIRVVR